MSARSTNCGGRSVAAGALLALLVLAAPAAAAAPGWSTQQLLTSTAAFDPAVAIDPAGNAVATWSDPGWGAVHASFRPAGQSAFGPPERLSEYGGRFPKVAFDGDGNAVVAWARLLRGDPDHWLVEAARLPRGGSFSEPQAVSPQLFYLQAEDIQLAVARGGRALIAYSGGLERNKGSRVWGALAPAGEPFSRPSGLSAGGADGASYFDAALGDVGEGVVTWVRLVPRGWPVSLSQDSYWEGVPVTAEGFGTTQPTPSYNGRSAVSSRGEAVYSWFDSQGYWAATAPPGGWFGEGQLVKPGHDDFYLDYNRVGNFPQNDGSMRLLFWAQDKNLYESTRPAGGLYGQPVELSGAPDTLDYEKTVGDREGHLLWFWAEGSNDQDEAENAGLKLVRRTIGEPFGEVESLTEPNVNPGYQLALGDGGRAVAIWSRSGRDGSEGTWVSSFPAGGDDYEYAPGDPFGAAAEPVKRPVTKERVGLRVSCYVACNMRLTGGVRTEAHHRFAKFEPTVVRFKSGGTRRVRLDLSRTASRWVREAAARNRRVRVRVKMRVSDQFGAGRTLQRSFSAQT